MGFCYLCQWCTMVWMFHRINTHTWTLDTCTPQHSWEQQKLGHLVNFLHRHHFKLPHWWFQDCLTICGVFDYETSMTALLNYILKCSVRVGISSYHTSAKQSKWNCDKNQTVTMRHTKSLNVTSDPYEYDMDLCNESCLSGRPATLQGKNLNIGQYTQTVQPNFCHTCNAYRHHLLLPFYTISTDLHLSWESQGQHKAKAIGIIFYHTFQRIRMKFDVMISEIELGLILSKNYSNKGTAV